MRIEGDGGSGGLGYVLQYGANVTVPGEFAHVNGIPSAGQPIPPTPSRQKNATIPKTGTLVALAWNTQSADATTVMEFEVNDVSAGTTTLSGAQGLNTGLSIAVVQGQTLSIQNSAGTAPNQGQYTLYIE